MRGELDTASMLNCIVHAVRQLNGSSPEGNSDKKVVPKPRTAPFKMELKFNF